MNRVRVLTLLALLVALAVSSVALANAASVDNGVSVSCSIVNCTFQNSMDQMRTCSFTVYFHDVGDKDTKYSGSATMNGKGNTGVKYRQGGYTPGRDEPTSVDLKCTGPN